ncbi:Ppx/GppA family phosphatase [Thalassospira alkalitolerans]|uniref:Phosphatase n=1 Tax=Thalassospira alkalitolerans TaxID=1293890 RepID=A0A1Y2LBD7_9PROT|nr:Ppx/GppA family phosphatase [Thalassospira alkalitolerans]OSQ48037.1 phosphatase [Thalassospira alkalitolerans]|tara:strand:+ start:4730 stop:6217 length:1488 start_codon:yes stop_codon:yes gene_type:complete
MLTDQRVSNRIAIIDVGSNSVRLVVFDGMTRAPAPIFNEKVMCGLGRDPENTGKLNPEGVEMAVTALRRFACLLRAMKIARVDTLATAAVRAASDGADFCARIHAETGLTVKVIDGLEEARLSALGIISGDPRATGIMGDIGGGSLELVLLEQGEIKKRVSVPLGAMRLHAVFDGDRARLEAEVKTHLDSIDWLHEGAGKPLIAVGGSWRSIAKLYIAQENYPISVVHNLAMPRAEIAELTHIISQQSRVSLDKIGGVSKRRIDSLPHAALVMNMLLGRMKAKEVVFSSHGLREGWMHEVLPEELRQRDPLLDACLSFAKDGERFHQHGEELFRWSAPIFRDQPENLERLRLAACIIGDVGWNEHPDYRAIQSYNRILHHPYLDLNHHDRVFLAYTIGSRYTGNFKGDESSNRLLDDETHATGRLFGHAIRLGHTLSGGVEGLLTNTALVLEEGKLVLQIHANASSLSGEVVDQRLAKLAKLMDRESEVRITDTL